MWLRSVGFGRRCTRLVNTVPCAAAHAWVGLGRIVYATSAAQLNNWLAEWRAPTPPVAPLPITTVAPKAVVDGPAPALEEELKSLYAAKYQR